MKISSSTFIGQSEKSMTLSALSAVNEAIKAHEKEAQALHIIIASIIKTNKDWKTIVKFVRESDQDIIKKPAIVFCHLPYKYNDLYDDLLCLESVDHVNLIDDDSIWNNITAYLLDIIFYQAVHFRPLQPIAQSDGGYLKEKEKEKLTQPTLDELMDVFNIEKNYDAQKSGYAYNNKFTENINGLQAHSMESELQVYLRTGVAMNKHVKKQLKHC